MMHRVIAILAIAGMAFVQPKIVFTAIVLAGIVFGLTLIVEAREDALWEEIDDAEGDAVPGLESQDEQTPD